MIFDILVVKKSLYMRILILLFIGLISLDTVYAQESNLFIDDSKSLNESMKLPEDTLGIAVFSMNAGVSAFADFEGTYGFSTYLAPQWSIKPLKRVQVDIMPYMGRTSYYNLPLIGQADATKLTFDQNMMNFGVYAQATYLINEKWYAGAAIFLDTNIPESNIFGMKGISNYGASTYVGYKFSDNFSMEASFGVSKYPMFYSPRLGYMPLSPRNPYNRF